jgi:hypothetical protein
MISPLDAHSTKIPLRSSKLLLILQDFAWKLQNLWLPRIPGIQKIGHGGVSEFRMAIAGIRLSVRE